MPLSQHKQIPYATVALLWARGKTVSQISNEMGWTRPRSKFPYSYTYGVLKRLRKGVALGLVTIRINEKRKTPASLRSKVCPLCLRKLADRHPELSSNVACPRLVSIHGLDHRSRGKQQI